MVGKEAGGDDEEGEEGGGEGGGGSRINLLLLLLALLLAILIFIPLVVALSFVAFSLCDGLRQRLGRLACRPHFVRNQCCPRPLSPCTFESLIRQSVRNSTSSSFKLGWAEAFLEGSIASPPHPGPVPPANAASSPFARAAAPYRNNVRAPIRCFDTGEFQGVLCSNIFPAI